jgi:hypothetical protein
MPLTKGSPGKGEMKNLFKKGIVPQEGRHFNNNGNVKRNFTQEEYDEIYGISKK